MHNITNRFLISETKTLQNLNNRFIKATNTFVCIDLPRSVAETVNREYHKGVQMIHVFVYDPENVRIDSLKAFAKYAQEKKNLKVIVHCFTSKDLHAMRKKLKGVYKDMYFHLNLVKVRYFHLSISHDWDLFIDSEKTILKHCIYENGKCRKVESIEAKYKSIEENA